MKRKKTKKGYFFKKDLNSYGGFNFKRPADKVFSKFFKSMKIR